MCSDHTATHQHLTLPYLPSPYYGSSVHTEYIRNLPTTYRYLGTLGSSKEQNRTGSNVPVVTYHCIGSLSLKPPNWAIGDDWAVDLSDRRKTNIVASCLVQFPWYGTKLLRYDDIFPP